MIKKVLHIRSSGGLLGAENVIIELCKRAEAHNYVAIAGAIKNVHDPFPEFLEVAQKHSIGTVVFPCKNQFDFSCGRAIKKYVEDNHIDIIHTHGYKEDFFTILSNVKIPKIATNHLWKKTSIKDRFYCFLDSMFLKRFDQVVGVSGEIVSDLLDKKIRSAIKISNGIDLKRFPQIPKSEKLLDAFGIDRQTKVIGMISSITPEKGHEIALRAFAGIINKHENVKLIVVGDGHKLPDLKKLSSELGIDKSIIFTRKRSDVPALLSLFDIYLMTSFTEGLPMSLLEAMAAQKAVIATRVGEIPEVIDDGENGFLIKPGEVAETQNALMRLLSMNANERQSFGTNAHQTVVDRYSSEAMAKNYFALYDSLLVS